jgi:major membrane immunogen (membrane-anchored lipoprotein)
MKAWLIPAFVAALLLTGCAQSYVLRLNNGREIIAATKPKSDGHGWYRFKDADGKEVKVNELRVREIEAQ